MNRALQVFACALSLIVGFLVTPAEASGSTLSAHAPATIPIYARGAAAYVPLTYTCPTNPFSRGYAFADVSITERVAGGTKAIAEGTSENLVCDGKPHISSPVSVTPSTLGDPGWPRALEPTSAGQVQIQLLACNGAETFCLELTFHSTAKLVTELALPSPYIHPQARLLVGSGGAAVRVNFRCPPGTTGLLDVSLTERVGVRVLSASSYPEIQITPQQCDNQPHSTWAPVEPPGGGGGPMTPAGPPFVAGSAWAELVTSFFGPSGISGISTTTVSTAYGTVQLLPAS